MAFATGCQGVWAGQPSIPAGVTRQCDQGVPPAQAFGTVATALPQGAAAGYGSYIVGQAARHYFQHGASWGDESPKEVVKQILANTDKESVLERLKTEIGKKISLNRYAGEK